jgi:hypothetical protein
MVLKKLQCLLGMATLPLLAQAQSLNPLATSSESASLGASSSRQMLNPTGATQSLPRALTPALPRASYAKYPWKMDIVTTVFWVGEGTSANNMTPNDKSSWDTDWQRSFGGFDDPDSAKRGPDYRPVSFVPKLNPFYVALPYNDVVSSTTTKDEAKSAIPWFKQSFKGHGKSVCRDHWIAVRLGDRICYAQWSDCGPFVTDDVKYDFGDARPVNSKNNGAGLDISPAVRDYLGFKTSAKCDWRFVDLHEVPDGPWKVYGENNHFAKTQTKESAQKDLVASRLEELRRQRDQWFRNSGAQAAR